MTKILNLSLLFLSLCLFTGCFDVIEDITLNEDGSGSFKLTLNLSQSKETIQNYLQAGTVQGTKLPTQQEVDGKIDDVKWVLSNIKGISDVQIEKDWDEFIYRATGNFTNVKALNTAINTVANELNQSGIPTIMKDNFAYNADKREFQRLFKYRIPNVFDDMEPMIKYMMETATITTIQRLPSEVKSTSNEGSNLSRNKKSVLWKSTVAELVKGEKRPKNTIQF